VHDEGSTRKRRGQIERQDTSELGELRVKGGETDVGVKEVTRGVKEVELEDKKEEISADEGKGTAEESSEAAEGVPNVVSPLDPAQARQKDDDLSQDATVTEDKTQVGQSETIVDTSSNDSVELEAPKSADVTELLVQVDNEKEQSDVSPAASSDEVADATESAVIP
jgi:hypothetical protein